MPEPIWERIADGIDRDLAAADAALAREYPGAGAERQPIHTVYVPADRFHARLPAEWGAAAIASMERVSGVQDCAGLAADSAVTILERALRKLAEQPVEDLRVDFEDGYGDRADAAEDADAERCAAELIRMMDGADAAPIRFGIRMKSFDPLTRRRGIRTLAIVVGALTVAGRLDRRFVLTLPKVTSLEQVRAVVGLCETWEAHAGLPAGTLRFEIQVETPQSILASDGSTLIARAVHASRGRCVGLHYGTYDYSAYCGIAGRLQSMEHPAADYAKAVMQVAAAGTGTRVSDGSTNVLPVGEPDRVRAAWALHARLVRRSLERGFPQGWDLHPAQLPTRLLATYAFYREGLAGTVGRLEAFLGRRPAGAHLDEPATAAALAEALHRGLECGAVDESEIGLLQAEELAGLRLRAIGGAAGESCGVRIGEEARDGRTEC